MKNIDIFNQKNIKQFISIKKQLQIYLWYILHIIILLFSYPSSNNFSQNFHYHHLIPNITIYSSF